MQETMICSTPLPFILILISTFSLVHAADTAASHFPNENTDPARLFHFNEAYRIMTGKEGREMIYDTKGTLSLRDQEKDKSHEKREAFMKIKNLITRRNKSQRK